MWLAIEHLGPVPPTPLLSQPAFQWLLLVVVVFAVSLLGVWWRYRRRHRAVLARCADLDDVWLHTGLFGYVTAATGRTPEGARVRVEADRVELQPAPWLEPRAGSDCPYCRQPLGRARDEPAVRCPACDVQHHTECWQEHAGCAVFACDRSPQRDRRPKLERL